MSLKENLKMTKLDPKKIYEQAKKNVNGKVYDEKNIVYLFWILLEMAVQLQSFV